MELWHILVILFSHTVADFVLQSDEVAKGKSSDNWILLKHIMIYTAAMMPCAVVVSGPLFMLFLSINAAAHFVTDYITSRITSYYWQREERHKFFVTIGFDQFAHAAALLITYAFLLV